MTTALVTSAVTSAPLFGVRFLPGEAFAFTGLPAGEVRDLSPGLADVWRPRAVALGDRVAAAGTRRNVARVDDVGFLQSRAGGFGYDRGMTLTNVTPLHVVDRIEPALPFWEKLGWSKDVEVPHDGRLGFVLLSNGGRALMLQTRASLAEDLPAVSALGVTSALYVDVHSIAEAVTACEGARTFVRERITFYGAREAWVVAPGGVVVGFAEHAKTDA